MKFVFTKEWASKVPLEEDLRDPAAGSPRMDPAALAESQSAKVVMVPKTPVGKGASK